MVDRTKLRAFGNQGTCRFTFRFRSPIRGRDCQGSFFRRPTILSAHSTGRARSGTQPPRVPSRSDTMMEATRRKEPPTPRCPHISWNSTARWATNVTGYSYTCPERPWGNSAHLRKPSRVFWTRDGFWRRGLRARALMTRGERPPVTIICGPGNGEIEPHQKWIASAGFSSTTPELHGMEGLAYAATRSLNNGRTYGGGGNDVFVVKFSSGSGDNDEATDE